MTSKTKRYAFSKSGATQEFTRRISELEQQLRRLQNIQAGGGGFVRSYVQETTVRRHKRKAHWVLRAIRRK